MGDSSVMVSVKTIKQSPLGVELDQDQCERLSQVVSAVALKHGSFLLEEGHRDDAIHIVTSGTLEVVKQTGGGDWVTLQLLRPGDMAGALGFIDGVEHSAAIRTVTNTESFSLTREALEQLLKTDPKLVYRVMRAIIRSVHDILRRMNLQHVEMTNYINQQHGRY
jgi:CRP-like cAMP-binding protein